MRFVEIEKQLGTDENIYRLMDRTFVVIEMAPEYIACLGISGDREKALGIAYDYLNEIVEEDDEVKMKPVEEDDGYGGVEYIDMTISENTHHSELKYDVRILHHDRLISFIDPDNVDKLRNAHPDYFNIRKRTCRL